MEITDKNFDGILTDNEVVMVDCWAEWCSPCRAIAPTMEELSEEFTGKIIVGKYNVDENMEFSNKFGIRNIPTILFFKKGKLEDKIVGVVGKSKFVDKINKLI